MGNLAYTKVSNRYPLMSLVGMYLLGDLESVENEVTSRHDI